MHLSNVSNNEVIISKENLLSQPLFFMTSCDAFISKIQMELHLWKSLFKT